MWAPWPTVLLPPTTDTRVGTPLTNWRGKGCNFEGEGGEGGRERGEESRECAWPKCCCRALRKREWEYP